MKKFDRKAIVMGLSVNGLGVLRSLGDLGVDCVGFYVDEKEELGIHSKYIVDKIKVDLPVSNSALISILKNVSARLSLFKPLLIPTTDYFAEFICNCQVELRDDFIFRCPSFELHESFLDKAQTADLCKSHSMPIPKTELPENLEQLLSIADDFQYPVIVKPRKTFGTGFPGKNYIGKSKNDLIEFFNSHSSLFGSSIVQEIIESGDGNIFVTAAYSGKDSRVTEVYVGRKLRQYPPDYGVTCFGESLPVPFLENLTRRFLDGIGYRGFSALEFARDKKSGSYFFLELNTRTYYHNQLFSDANVDLNKIAYYEMIDENYKNHLPEARQRSNLIWIDFKRDLSSFYRKRKAHEIKFGAWLFSIFKARSFAYLNFKDLRPFLASTLDLLSKLLRFPLRMGREKGNSEVGTTSENKKRPIKILFMIDWVSRGTGGGTENHLASLISRLNREKFLCSVCVFDSQFGPILERIQKGGASVYNLPVGKFYTPSAIGKLFKLVKYIKSNKFNIVQTYHFKSDTYGVIASKLAGVDKIISGRRDLGELKKKRHIIFNKIINPLIDHFVMVCDAVGAACSGAEGISRRKMSTIYNGVDLSRFQITGCEEVKELRRSAGIRDDAFVIGSIAHFRPEKAYHIFFEGIEKARSRIPSLHALILGDGPLRKKFEDQCKEHEISGNVTFLGSVIDVPKYIPMMDVLCLVPNSNEGFSNAIIEGMAMARPVIATDVGGNREAVVDGVTGILIPPDDSEKLSQSLVRLYENPEERLRMGSSGRRRIEEHFTIDGMVSKMEQFYERTLERSRS